MVHYYKNIGTNNQDKYQFVNEHFLCSTMLDLGSGAKPIFIDVDADNDLDLIVCTQGEYTQTKNANDRLVLFLNKSTQKQVYFELVDTNFLNINNHSINLNQKTFTISYTIHHHYSLHLFLTI